jgi:pimeloyl-ACP methyl ester carboxylesterase
MMDDMAEATRLVGTGWDEHGNDTAQSVLTGTNLTVRALALTTPDVVVPVLLVPGIMGTRLRVKERQKGAAWFPPEGTWDAIVMALKHLNKSAADRQKLLDPNNTEVDDSGPAHPDASSKALLAIAEGATDAERARWRGWGQLYGASYTNILCLLETSLAMLFDPASQGKELSRTWKSLVMDRQDAAKLGAQKPFVPLQEADLRTAADVLYPVHGVGYNWLQSNKRSGERLAREIERITAHYRGKGKVCEKVLIVTHSMGGLVARACAQMPGMADKILGIVHGVMPAIGAPATYKRIRAGFEGVSQVILGRNAAECTAVMANAPGPLELLPTAQYRTRTQSGERHWLRASHTVKDGAGHVEEVDTLLGERDPYEEIYLDNSDNWWKLVREELIDPAGREERERARRAGKELVEENPGESDFKRFRTNMDVARSLHTLIANKYHPSTYAYYGADPKHPAWNEVHWKCGRLVDGDLKTASLADDDFNGSLRLSIRGKSEHVLEIQPALGSGDGTVPAESGSAPTPHVVQIFRHEGKAKGHETYDHQDAYKAKLAQSVTLYSIVRIVADSEWIKHSTERP